MPIHQQLWSLECSVVETVASLLRGVMEQCLAEIQSHCPDKVNDIQAVRKSSTDQCNSSGHTFVFCRPMKKTLSFSTPKNSDAYHQLFWELGSWMAQPLWRANCRHNNKLILGVCLVHPFFLSDVLETSLAWQVVQTVLYPTAKAILPRLTCLLRQNQNWGRFLWATWYFITLLTFTGVKLRERPKKSGDRVILKV